MSEEGKSENQSQDSSLPAKKTPHRFQPGNKLGRGDPFLAQRERFRSKMHAIFAAEGTYEKIIKSLAKKAQEGEGWAIKEVLDRLLGKPLQPNEMTVSVVDRRITVSYELPAGQDAPALPAPADGAGEGRAARGGPIIDVEAQEVGPGPGEAGEGQEASS